MNALDVDANGNMTSDHAGFVVVFGQVAILVAINQCAKSAIRNKANKPKLVFLPRFYSIFFSINLVNVTTLRFVVWHYFAYYEKILSDIKAQLPI